MPDAPIPRLHRQRDRVHRRAASAAGLAAAGGDPEVVANESRRRGLVRRCGRFNRKDRQDGRTPSFTTTPEVEREELTMADASYLQKRFGFVPSRGGAHIEKLCARLGVEKANENRDEKGRFASGDGSGFKIRTPNNTASGIGGMDGSEVHERTREGMHAETAAQHREAAEFHQRVRRRRAPLKQGAATGRRPSRR